MSVRKSSHGTIFLIVSSGSPFALIASSLRSISKKPFCPMTDSPAPSAHYRVGSPSQIRAGLARGIFRGALKIGSEGEKSVRVGDDHIAALRCYSFLQRM